MVILQKRPSFARRFFGWFGRHKVTTVFVVLLLAIGVYWVGTDIVWRMQVQDERAQYMAAKQLLDDIAKEVPVTGDPKLIRESACGYTDNGAVFATRFLGCQTSIEMAYSQLSKESSEAIMTSVQSVVQGQRVSLIESDNRANEYVRADYNFSSETIPCTFSLTYYDNDVPDFKRDRAVSSSGSAALVAIVCGRDAKAEHFPVVDN